MGVADAAQLFSDRAAAETRRLEAALREEERLHALLTAARAALAPVSVRPEEGTTWRERCG
jgi:hypothetical protein